MPTHERLPPEGYEMGPGWEVGGGFECTCKGHWGEECVYRHDPQKRGDKYVAGACHVHAEAMGAIVRKAEALARAQMNAAVAFIAGPGIGDDPIAWHGSIDDSKARMYEALAAIKRAAVAPPEQPSGNPGELLCACGAPRALGVMLCPACKMESDKHHEGCLCLKCDLPDCTATFHQAYCRLSPERGDKPAEAPAAPVGELDSRASAAAHLALRDARIAALEAEVAEADRAISEEQTNRQDAESDLERFQAEAHRLECDRDSISLELAEAKDNVQRVATRNIEVAEQLAAMERERDDWKRQRVDVGVRFDLYRANEPERVAAAVQADRERVERELRQLLADDGPYRGIRWTGSIEIAIDRIKNGDPKP